MKRREFIAAGAGTGVAALAGCTSLSQVAGQLDARWEYEWEALLRSTEQAVVVTTGRIRNEGDGGGEFDLQLDLLDVSGEVRQSTRVRIEGLAPDEEQQFWAKFPVSERLDSIDTVEVSAPDLKNA
jgi:hypothetical protein